MASAKVIASTPASPLLATCSNAVGSFGTSPSTVVGDTTVVDSVLISFLSQKAAILLRLQPVVADVVVSFLIPRVMWNEDDDENNIMNMVINAVECNMIDVSSSEKGEMMR